MSQGIMRKSQPFTIGTKLSLTKCQDYAMSGCGVRTHIPNLNDCVSEYLALTAEPSHEVSSPQQGTPRSHQAIEDCSDNDQLNRSSLARSIRRISLSIQQGPEHQEGPQSWNTRGLPPNALGNFNNNNGRILRNVVPDFMGATSVWTEQRDIPKDTENPNNHMVRTDISRDPIGPNNHMVSTDISRDPIGPNNHMVRTNITRDPIGPNNHMVSTDISRDPIGPHNHMVRTNITRDPIGPNNHMVRTDNLRDTTGPSNQTVRTGILKVNESPVNHMRRNNLSCVNGCVTSQTTMEDTPAVVDGPSCWTLRDDIPRVFGVQYNKTPTPQVQTSGLHSQTDSPRKHLASFGSRRFSPDTGSHLVQLSRDITQAEAWVRGKLRDLGDRCDAKPLRDWEQGAPTAQSEIMGFESTVARLTQIGENLTRTPTPSTECVRLQLQSLRDQWQLLKQTTTNQSNALGRARTLQDFNKKADELEMWMREQEEAPSLNHLLGEHSDKIQLTRRILDLKQEQLHYRNLQESINNLAQKLEKQGRPESKATSTRRKHLNKMWLRIQDSLQDHQQTLQLALEAASLWQQADSILKAIEDLMKTSGAVTGGDCEGQKERNVRDIASHIMVLDITVSQVSSLHPILASKAGHKQQQVKERWAKLQQALRMEKPPRPDPSFSFTRERNNPVASSSEGQSSVGSQQQGIVGSQTVASWREYTHRGNHMRSNQDSSHSPVHGDIITVRQTERKKRRNSLEDQANIKRDPEDEALPQKPCSGAPEVSYFLHELDYTEQWLDSVEDRLSEPTSMRSPEVIRRDLREVAVLEREVKSRGLALHLLQDRVRGTMTSGQSIEEERLGKVKEMEDRFRSVQDVLRRRTSDLRDSLVLSEFMKIVQLEEEKRKREILSSGSPVPDHANDTELDGGRREMFTPLEELQEAVEMLNEAVQERERVVAVTKEVEQLTIGLSSVSQMISAAQVQLENVMRDTAAAERSFSGVKRQEELRELQGLIIEQQQLEAHISGALQREVRRLEEEAEQLQGLCPERAHLMGRQVQDKTQAWAQLQEKIQENQARLQSTSQLRGFFHNYLAIISWTEETRAQIVSECPGESMPTAQREELERRIAGKLREFEHLASVGWKFIGEKHFLTQTIQERLEELQGMLSWVLMRWRCQKQQRIMGKQTDRSEPKDALPDASHVPRDPSPADTPHVTSCIPREAFESIPCTVAPARGPTLRRYERQAHSPMSMQSHLSLLAAAKERQAGGKPQEVPPRPKCAEGPVWLEPRETPGGAVTEEQEEIIYTVSTYLHVNDSKAPQPNAHQSLTVPRPSKKAQTQDRYSLPAKSGSGTTSATFSKLRPSSLFSSLKRREKAQRCTIQGIMGLHRVELQSTMEDTKMCQTYTWPPKQLKKIPARASSPDIGKMISYVKNPLTRDIDAQCVSSGSVLKKADLIGESLHLATPKLTSSSRHLDLGSILSLELPMDTSLLGDIQDNITVMAKDPDLCEDLNLINVLGQQQRDVVLESVEAAIHEQTTKQEHYSQSSKSWIEELTSSPGYCRQNLHGYGRHTYSPDAQQLDASHEEFICVEIDRLSPIADPTEHYRSESKDQDEDIIHSSPERADHCVTISSIQSDSGVPRGSHIALINTENKSSSPVWELSQCKNLQPYNTPRSPTAKRALYKAGSSSLPEVLHPDHEFLEQDDEELEGIWNNARRSSERHNTQTCRTIMHNMGEIKSRTKAAGSELVSQKPPVHIVSKPNVMVATFRLPTSSNLAKDTERQRGKTIVEEASRNKKLNGDSHPKVQHQQSCSGHDTDGLNHQSPAMSCKEEEAQLKSQVKALKLTKKLDFQLMEGPLERKHIMQQGGRKASCRTWSLYHVVLVRRTLCFYQDRKYSPKSTLCAPPLTLTGAVCSMETDYTKRNNCFRLRLPDGSEYLFRAPSSTLLQEWVSKLQHNSGLEESDPLGEPSLEAGLAPSLSTRGLLGHRVPDLCQSTSLQDKGKLEGTPQAHGEQSEAPKPSIDGTKDATCPAMPRLSYSSSVESSRMSSTCTQEEDCSLVANRRRSRSFSSVTYQKMASFSRPQKGSPSYSVTLYISDPPASRGRSHSFAECLEVSPEWGVQSGIPGDPKPRNKSVFRKLFRKKD